MSRRYRLTGLLVSLALVGAVAIEAPSTGVAKKHHAKHCGKKKGQKKCGHGTAPSSSISEFVGVWLGPYPGETASCGSSYSEIVFNSNSTYSTQYGSSLCGTFSVWGTFSVSGSTLNVHQTGTDCGDCQQSLSYSVPYSFINANALDINGYTYYRQS